MKRKLLLLLALVLLLQSLKWAACGKKEPAVVEDDGPEVVDDEPADDTPENHQSLWRTYHRQYYRVDQGLATILAKQCIW